MNALKTIETKESSKIFKTTLKEESKMKKIALTLLSLVLLMTFSGMASAADDHANSYLNATPVTYGVNSNYIAGKIDYAYDEDWFVIKVTQSMNYAIGTLDIYFTDTVDRWKGADTVGTLFDSKRVAYCLKGSAMSCGLAPNVPIAWNDDYSYPADWNFRIIKYLPAGIYFLKVQGYGTVTGKYVLHMQNTIETWNW